ncbi:AEC family transporter [Paracoccaceae bacterium]|nr:AEC family transporter [Paracoccaceae bacterium]
MANARETAQPGVHYAFSNHDTLEYFYHLSGRRIVRWPTGDSFGRPVDRCFSAFDKYSKVVVLAFFGPPQAQSIPIAHHVLKNPLVQACAIGITINLSGLSLPDFALQTLDLLGRAALGVGILAIGAGVNAERLFQRSTAMIFGVVFRMTSGPVIFLAVTTKFCLGPTEVLIGIIILVGPAASNGYILAKKMGGDANLYADILAWQTILSMRTLPLFILAITTALG